MKSKIKAFLVGTTVGLGLTSATGEPREISVSAAMETQPVAGDADDPAIWVHPTDPGASLILGTDKTRGLYVFNLKGEIVAEFPDGRLNNVDIRPFRLGDRTVWLAGATKREDDTLVFYVIHPDGRVTRATPFQHPGHPEEVSRQVDDIYGFAMQRLADGRVFALANYKSGHVFQWEVIAEGEVISTRLVRQWTVPSQPEGIVSDDRSGDIFVGEEDHAIWKLSGAPETSPELTKVATIPSTCLPKDDVEGLSIYDGPAGRYLVASAQGNHRVALYDLDDPSLPCVGLIEIAAGNIDGVSETDGLDVTAYPLPGMPQGALVVMDDQNAGFTTNYKLIDWSLIATALK